MPQHPRRSFRPVLDGHALEDRVVLSAVAGVVAMATATATIDPLNPPPTTVVLNEVMIHREVRRIHSAFQTFISRYERAAQNAAKAVTNGQSTDSGLAGLLVTASIDSGNLQTQLQKVAQSFPAGGQYLYNPPQGPLPAGTTYPDPSTSTTGPDIRYYVPPDLRFKTQVQTLVSVLNGATTLQQATSPDTVSQINTFAQNCRAALARYLRAGAAQGLFVIPGLSQS